MRGGAVYSRGLPLWRDCKRESQDQLRGRQEGDPKRYARSALIGGVPPIPPVR